MFDVDGTLWCERPTYLQWEFFVWALQNAVSADAALGEREEYRAVLDGDRAALDTLGLPRIAMALADVLAESTPAEFDGVARRFFTSYRHSTLARPVGGLVYRPMRELLDALRVHGFEVFLVTGGGTEFVRAISDELFDVAPERVVGTMIRYRFERRDGAPVLVRTNELDGPPNEGEAKVEAIQRHLGRRPRFAAGNSLGDRELLDLAHHTPGPSLALLVNHDDGEREFAYASEAATIAETEPFTNIADASGWTQVSMRTDWATIFDDQPVQYTSLRVQPDRS
jgi:phosphoserine phosphatase